MGRAIELSRKGFPAPNPHVGCVIVANGEIVGEGFHDHAGAPHAEAEALASAGDMAKGATAYVTLEPCDHMGRTPPCSGALIAAGIARVIAAVADPNPKAAGGLERLSQAGIEIDLGLLEDEARVVNWQFLTAMEHRRPAITLKAAMSLDGRIALPNGDSKWITSEESRQAAHRLRAECGAVLVGRNTIELDDPLLTARIPGVVNQPTRIVLDPHGRLTGRERVFGPEGPTLRITSDGVEEGDIQVPADGPSLDLAFLLRELGRQGLTGLLVEGGEHTISAFLEADLWDRIVLFVAPKLLGAGPSWANFDSMTSLAAIKTLQIAGLERIGGDICLTIVRP